MLGDEDRLVIETVPQLIWVTDAEGSVIYVNRQYTTYTGFAAEQLCGQTAWRKALHPDDLERCLHDWKRAVKTSTEFETEYRLRRAADATWRWHLARAVPIRDAAGRVTKWVGSSTDIEEQKRMEARKDEFLAMLGHELRNPLTPILGAVSLLKEREQGPTRPHFEMIERQALHMARLVDDLLDVGRLSRGRIQLRKEAVEVAALVDRAAETARPLVAECGHQLIIEVPRGLAVDGDPLRLAQVIANLLNNAAKYTPPGGTICVSATRDGNTAVIAVRDTGEGIAAEHLPYIFDLFVQGARTLDRSQGGLGIGLTLVRRLVELHGGTVRAHSDGPGRGSELVVTLPVALACAVGEVARSTSPPTTSVFAGRKLLVVDDHVDIANVLTDYLTWKGYDVIVAHDGRSALELAYSARPDIVLLDIGLPVLDGYQVARLLRASPQFAATPIVALTGYGQRADVERALRAGFDDHLVKPIDFPRLLSVLASCVTTARSRHYTACTESPLFSRSA